MGYRHNTLSDNIFRNSKYINALEQALEITDFRKEYKEQYDIMLDVFKTLIKINNILFADSNKNLYDKKIEILDTLTIALYGSLESDDVDTGKYKYSTRIIKNLIDSHTRHLFNKFIEWYDYLSNINELDFVKKEVEEEMNALEYVEFDSVVKENISYKKNKDSGYKIYISKLDYLYPNQKEALKKYKQEFQDIYGLTLQIQDLNEIYFIYKLIAYGNNALVRILTNNFVSYNFNLSERSLPEDFFNAYLYALGMDIEDAERFKKLSEEFWDEALITNNVLIELTKDKVPDPTLIVFAFSDLDDYFSNYNLYFFYINMTRIADGSFEFSIKSDILLKIIQDLKEAFNLMRGNILINVDKEKLEQAWNIMQKIIKRNQDLFERVS